MNLFQDVLRTTNFLYHGQFNEQLDGVAMESQLSPMIADFYMEAFEKTALQGAPYKPLYKQYMDDTFLIWPHGQERLEEFVTLLNNRHENIKLTEVIEKTGCFGLSDLQKPEWFIGP